MGSEKYIDESWKESAAQEKERLENVVRSGTSGKTPTQEPGPGTSRRSPPEPVDSAGPEPATATEEDFINYVTSLAYQAMIFLGEIPNPVSNETEQNLQQVKFVIDTLILLQEKTKGNLTKKESDVLNTAAYELQMKYVEIGQRNGAAHDG